FEYRPLDLYLPFLFLLMADGARRLARGPRAAVALAGYLVLVLAGIAWLPYQSHRQFPSRYHPGFPGSEGLAPEERDAYLAPARDPISRLPGLRWVAGRYVTLLRTMTRAYVGIRQEEHRLFLDTVVPEGKRLRELVEEGVLPADTYIAVDCVGAIPYC